MRYEVEVMPESKLFKSLKAAFCLNYAFVGIGYTNFNRMLVPMFTD